MSRLGVVVLGLRVISLPGTMREALTSSRQEPWVLDLTLPTLPQLITVLLQ